VACERPVPGLSPDTLILLADRALYQAKRQGRDRVSVLEYQPVPAP
jgi:PleD family two-component response regulator